MAVTIIAIVVGVAVIAITAAGIEIYQKITRLNEAKKVLKSTLKNYIDNAQATGRCTVLKFEDLDKM
jgi:hypothetical protein